MSVLGLAYCSDAIVNRLIDDITQRKGLGDEWDGIDEETQQQIRADWRALVEQELARLRGD